MAEQTLTMILITHNPSFNDLSLLYKPKSMSQDAIFSEESSLSQAGLSPRVIHVIGIKYNEIESPMLRYKFCLNWPNGSWKEDYQSVFTIYGLGSHLGHVTSIMLLNFHFLVPKSLHTAKFG